MYELFVMSLREYWKESPEDIDDLKNVLADYYGFAVEWDEPEVAADAPTVPIDTITDIQLCTLQLVAAKLELDGNLDGLKFSSQAPWEADVFERLDDELIAEDTDNDIEKFPHLLTLGDNRECLMLPVDLPHIASIGRDDCDCDDDCCCGDDDCCCHDHECDCGHDHGCCCHDHDEDCDCDCDDDCCCCCEQDDGSIEISSTIAIRRELDTIAPHLGLDPKSDIATTPATFSADDRLHGAKVAWCLLSSKVNEAIKNALPLIFRFNDEDYDD